MGFLDPVSKDGLAAAIREVNEKGDRASSSAKATVREHAKVAGSAGSEARAARSKLSD